AAYEKADLLCKSRFWIPESLPALAYASTDPVFRVGTINDAGRCADCEGTRRTLECSCPDYLAKKETAADRRSARAKREHRTAGDGPALGVVEVEAVGA